MEKKIAIVYDWIDSWGGVERLLLVLHQMFPHAEFFTSYYDPKKASWAKDIAVHTSFIQKLPAFIRKNRLLSFIFYPYAFESFNFTDYDLVISVTSSFAKGIITKPRTKHICILLTPTRYLWLYPQSYLIGWKKMLNPFRNAFKRWDRLAAQRPDKIIAISRTVEERCRQFYGRVAEVVYPPFDTEYWQNKKEKIKHNTDTLTNKEIPEEFYLIVSRLEPYKKVELAIEAFAMMPDKTLVVAGDGRERRKLERESGRNIIFTGYVSDDELTLLYGKAKALIMPQEEDFGYVSLEAQNFGCPVIAYGKGGALETVEEGITGLTYTNQSAAAIVKAVERFEANVYNWKLPSDWQSDNRFIPDRFKDSLLKIIKFAI